jgi:DNA modification methylase
MTVRILQGDCRDVLKTLPEESVHCIVTSPPYWGLRDYGVPGQIGLEPDPDEWLAQMVQVFQEAGRVLRRDGTLWLNLGDAYGSGTRADRDCSSTTKHGYWNNPAIHKRLSSPAKQLLGLPWRVALALQANGWYLRQDIIWHKPNPMPESVTDRCTKAHEYLFLLAKSERYYYDADAIREPHSTDAEKYKTPEGKRAGISCEDYEERKWHDRSDGLARPPMTMKNREYHPLGRNKRSVWSVATQPYREAHFATFPPALISPCILAGCPEGGTVLDPFGGAGTTGLVADRLGRDALLVELNPEYVAMARQRIRDDAPLLAQVIG